ncbi:MAG TPA: hypothetical protein VLT32_04395 [Candidatus Sulfomarinibacteraceae bacterium]|nr:hypothetical protein [Candidatus Sulfomarinibacteraceae bacterium]
MISKILIVDPLTLLGRELLRCLEESPDLGFEIEVRHTSPDDEVQIAELAAAPALVAPLEADEELAGVDVVVVASDAETDRTARLERVLAAHPEVAVIDAGRLQSLRELTSPDAGLDAAGGGDRRVRVAHPALAAAAIVVRALGPFTPVRAVVAAVDPVSGAGRDAIETLAHQAARRLQGGTPDHLLEGHVRAFSQISVDPDALAEEAAVILPGLPSAVTLTLGGCFHGHLAHLVVELADPVDDFELRDLLEDRVDLVLVEPPLKLDDVVDRDQVLLSLPQLSADRRVVAFTAMVDGLRVGGAVTAVAILRSMM